MKKIRYILLALVLVLSLLLGGCFGTFPDGTVRFSQMQYLHPNMTAIEQSLAAVEQLLPTAQSADEIIKAFQSYYGQYQAFSTSYYLSFIHYSKDTSDIYWQKEYEFCSEQIPMINAGYDRLLYAMADCPLRDELEKNEYFGEGFFDAYEGESIYDEEMTALMDQESQLLNRYYDLSAQTQSYTDQWFSTTGDQLAQVFVELIALRQQIADHAGYSDFPSFAYDYYHLRDYTPQQAMAYCLQVRDELAPLHRQASARHLWETVGMAPCTEQQALAYLSQVSQAMGGQIQECYKTMIHCELYDISPGANKYDASYEVYLPSFQLPYLFTNPYGLMEDKLTLTHEFGHFCNDYASYGSTAGTDVSEIFSQGLEYLSLFYGEDTAELEQLKMLDCLDTYVTQSAYASFEHQVYSLEGAELTTEAVQTLYSSVCQEFGIVTEQWDSREYVMIPHYFTHPMYIISYVLSNDAALQLYQMEAASTGTGLTAYAKQLATQQPLLLEFLKEAGLKSPFEEGRLTEVRSTLESKLLLKTE